MAENTQNIRVTKNFTIPPDKELVKRPNEFKLKVNLYWVATIIRGISERNPKHKILPNHVLIDVGVAIIFDEPEVDLAASYICNTINYWNQIHVRDHNFFMTNADKLFVSDHIKAGTLQAIFSEGLIKPEEVAKVWNYLNVMIRQSIRWMNSLVQGNQKIVLCEKLADGKPNPNAVEMDRAKLLSLAKIHEVTDI